MPLIVNLRHLEDGNLKLKGELSAAELDIDTKDELVRVARPLLYDLEVEKFDQNLLVRGLLSLELDCECARCLKPFQFPMKIEDWTCHVPFEGEDAVPVVNDCVDLTPYVREDILLEFPQHPLCDPGCRGLEKTSTGKAEKNKLGSDEPVPSAWSELDKLKL